MSPYDIVHFTLVKKSVHKIRIHENIGKNVLGGKNHACPPMFKIGKSLNDREKFERLISNLGCSFYKHSLFP
eukprot:UN10989